jgi:hypothetical protein
MVAYLGSLDIDQVFHTGLHEFISSAIETTRRLSSEIKRAYHF